MIVSKTFTFDAGHQLIGHKGKCANVHGHTYKVEIGVLGEPDDGGSSEGMIIDFSDLKEAVKPVIDAMDHAFLLTGNEPIASVLVETGSKIYDLGVRSTAENLSAHMFNEIWPRLSFLTANRVHLEYIRIWETPTSMAEYTWEDYVHGR